MAPSNESIKAMQIVHFLSVTIHLNESIIFIQLFKMINLWLFFNQLKENILFYNNDFTIELLPLFDKSNSFIFYV